MFKKLLASLLAVLLCSTCFIAAAEAEQETKTNRYIQYYEPASEKARALCKDAETALEKYEIISDWCYKYLHYDYIKAYKMSRYGYSGPYPDVKDCFERKRGVCADIAATCVTMMRAAGLEAYYVKGKVYIHYLETEFGYAHAWIECIVDGQRYRFDPVSMHQFSVRKIPDIEYVAQATY